MGSGMFVCKRAVTSVAALFFGWLGVAGVPAFAASEPGVLEEIIVTAQKREESLQEVPLSITAFTGDYLESRQINNLLELTRFAPSMEFQRGTSTRNAFLTVRGIGSSGQNAGIDGSVGLYLDGVYIPRQGGLMQSLTDIQAVELLRGPQGTLYGANTPAGLLNVNTRAPTQEFEGRIEVGAGNFDMREVSGYVSGGLSDDVAGRLAFWSREHEGTVKLHGGGRSNSREDHGGRVRLLWSPSDTAEYEFIGDYSRVETVCCDGEWIDISDEALTTFDRMAAGLNLDRDLIFPNRTGDGFQGRGEKIDHESFSQGQGTDVIEHWGVSFRAGWTVFGDHELTAVLSYRDFDSEQGQDNDEVGVDVTLFADQPETHETLAGELSLSSPGDQFFTWTTGLFYFNDDAFFQQQSDMRLPGCMFTRNTEIRVGNGSLADTIEDRSRCAGHARGDEWDQTHESIAVFAQGDLNLTDRWTVSVGARVTRDDKDVDKRVRLFDAQSEDTVTQFGLNCPLCTFGTGTASINGVGLLFGTAAFEDSIDNTQLTWSASTQFFFTEEVMAYFRVATGYKSPGINARPIRFTTIPTNYDEETSENFELGIKSRLAGGRLQLNANIYFNRFDDLQQIAANPASDPSGALGTFVQNAGELEHQGVELEYNWLPVNWLSLSGGVSYLDSEFVEFRGTPCPDLGNVPPDAALPALCDLTGFRNVRTPEWRMNHTARVTFPIGDGNMEWFAQGSWIYYDDSYVTIDHDSRGFQDSYSLINLAAGIQSTDARWSIQVWGRNVGDEEYIVSLGNPAVPGNFGVRGSKVVYLGEQATYGLRATVNF
ncbi:MAG: TonB-dependent receptor [Pseudomonadales bacterium]